MKKTLETLCDILPGFQLRKGINDAERDGDAVRVVQIKDTEGGILHTDALETGRIKNARRYLVQEGDVLLLTRGHRFTATVVDTPLQDAIAVYFFLILRPRDPAMIDPAFLAWALNHPGSQEELHSKASTVHMPFLSPKEVREFAIEVPPREVQRKICELERLQRSEVLLSRALLEKRAQLVNQLTSQLATGELKP